MQTLKFFFALFFVMTALAPGQQTAPAWEKGGIRFFVDPATNSDDPEKRMAYGLNVTPPWDDGGWFFINLPEHLWYMPDTKGIARHHDNRKNVWKISSDGKRAGYAAESITQPGVFLDVKATAAGDRVNFEMTLTNKSDVFLESISPLFCYQYHHLKGFPAARTDNLSHTFILRDGKPVALKDISVKNPEAVARMAQVKDCSIESNWWAEEMGGMIEQRMETSLTALTSSSDDRKVVLSWRPGKSILSNTVIPCIHADACIGSLVKGESKTIRGTLLFSRDSLGQAIKKIIEEK